jgi:hypothetical protein
MDWICPQQGWQQGWHRARVGHWLTAPRLMSSAAVMAVGVQTC